VDHIAKLSDDTFGGISVILGKQGFKNVGFRSFH